VDRLAGLPGRRAAGNPGVRDGRSQDLHGFGGQRLEISRQAVYTVAFFAFGA
jgi:hypothetical protein